MLAPVARVDRATATRVNELANSDGLEYLARQFGPELFADP